MLCERCHKKEATVFYEERVNGVSRSLSLCHDCATALPKTNHVYAEDFFSLPYEGLFGSLFGQTEKYNHIEKTCPVCGASLRHFSKDGKVGCPECYRTFAKELEGTIHSIHGALTHVGRAPARVGKKTKDEDTLTNLKLQMKTAIEQENFELAASLRDKIRELEANEKEA